MRFFKIKISQNSVFLGLEKLLGKKKSKFFFCPTHKLKNERKKRLNLSYFCRLPEGKRWSRANSSRNGQ